VTVEAVKGDLTTVSGVRGYQLTPVPSIGEQAFLIAHPMTPFTTLLHDEIAFKRNGLAVIMEVQGSTNYDGSEAPPPPRQLEELAKRAADRIR
jgi:hypothetical protein